MDSSQPLDQKAIDAALEHRFDEALELNKQILSHDPDNVDALNRLARAYFETGNLPQAKKYYSKVLEFDSYNPIAIKNLKIIHACKKGALKMAPNGHPVSASLFLQEPGKTKVVTLLKVAEPQKISLTYCGMQVFLKVKNTKITVVDSTGSYLGVLPDDTSHQLTRLIKGGNKYDLFIKSVKVNSLAILIRETFRSNRFKNQPSFLPAAGLDIPLDTRPASKNQSDEEA